MEFEVVGGENLPGFELGNDVNGGGEEEEEEEQQREKRERESRGGGRRQLMEKGGTCTNYQVAPPYSLLFIWSKLFRNRWR